MEYYTFAYGLLAIVVFLLKSDIQDKDFYPLEFVLITLSGMYAYDWEADWNMWDVFSSLGGSATLALSFLALLGYLDYIRQEERIEVFFNYGDDEIPTGLHVLRKNCTRAEIQGLLRILSAGNLFNMKSVLKEKIILDLVDQIQIGKNKKLTLNIEKDEIEQFINLPDYEKVLEEYDIPKREKEKKVFYSKKTQNQIDQIEKNLNICVDTLKS